MKMIIWLILLHSVKLKAFKKFKDTKEALLSADKMIKGKFPKTLKKFLEKNVITDEVQETLASKEFLKNLKLIWLLLCYSCWQEIRKFDNNWVGHWMQTK